MADFPSSEKRIRRSWRLGHGTVFLVMLLLGMVVAGLAVSKGCELMKTFAARTTPLPTVEQSYLKTDLYLGAMLACVESERGLLINVRVRGRRLDCV